MSISESGNQIKMSSDTEDLNINFIIDYLLNETYWTKDRTPEMIRKSIYNSFCVSMSTHERIIGFARAVTDYATYAFIMDVFIVTEYQNKGYGTKLVNFLMEHEKLRLIRRFTLHTLKAEKFYTKIGFSVVESRLLVKKR